MRSLSTLLLSLLFCQISFAQLSVEVRVLEGTSDSGCSDVIGSPDHLWSVKVNEQDWTNYGLATVGFIACTYESVPNLQYSATADCPADLGEIEVCFRAFENDPSIFNVCGISPGTCLEEFCEVFPAVAGTYNLAIPSGRSAEGEVQFEIRTSGEFIGDVNDLPCTATDLGQVGAVSTIGDASIGSYNNYCGTRTASEPNPSDFLPSWTNNLGVWYSFTTLDEPIHRLQVYGTSDPEDIGDPIQLQIGIFAADACDGTFRYLAGSGSSGRDPDFDELIQIECSDDLLPNTTYYILIDGVDATLEQLNGTFGLEVRTEALLPNEIDATLCFGESLEIAGLFYNESGSFQDTITLPTGCDTIIHANITVLDELTIEVTQLSEATNEGATDGVARVSAAGGAGGYEFLWSDGNREPTNGNLTGGETVGITVTDENGCEASTSLFVDFIRPLMPIIIEDTLACFGDSDGEIILSVLEGRPPYSFEWSDRAGEQSGSGILRAEGETSTLSGLGAGEYSITVSDNISEDVVVTAAISQPQQLQLNIIENRSASCFSFCDARLEIDVQGGTPPYSFNFLEGDFDLTAFSNLCAGNFQLTITDANNCIELFDIEIEEPEEFIATAEVQDVTCFEGIDGAISISTNGNPNTYTWSNGETDANLNALEAGNYTLTVTNEDGCEDELNVTINEPATPLQVQIEVAQDISCFGEANGSLLANPSGAYESLQYTWSNGETGSKINELAPANYILRLENENGCIATDSFTLSQPDELRLDAFSTQDLGCTAELQVGAIQVDAVSGGTMPYEYSIDGIRFSSNNRIGSLEAGDYSIILRDAQGCETDETFSILAAPNLQVNLGEDRVVVLGQTLDLEAMSNFDNLQYAWEGIDSIKCDNCGSLSFIPLETRTYQVEVFDPITQCTASDAVMISISREEDIYLPTAFSPNADGKNDFFTLFSGPSVEAINNFKIFDRRGHVVYETPAIVLNDPNIGWDGRFQNRELRPSVFAFVAEVEYINGSREIIGGEFTLLR